MREQQARIKGDRERREMMEEKLKTIAEYYGLESQLRQLAEECSELAVEANHSARRGSVTVRLIEEIADVEIMIDQIRYLAGIQESDVLETRYYKIERQLKRMKQKTSDEYM